MDEGVIEGDAGVNAEYRDMGASATAEAGMGGDGGGSGVSFFMMSLLDRWSRLTSWPDKGRRLYAGWSTGDPGTRRTLRCPAHSRHNSN